MTLTLKLNETTAKQLNLKAAARHVSVEDLASQILNEAIQRIDADEKHANTNQRRQALIRKSVRESLTDDEKTELQSLQAAAERDLEAMDNQLLNELAKMRAQVY